MSAPLPDQFAACALRAAAECREPIEWWATAAAVNHPSTGPLFGGYAPLTSKDLGPACISIEQREAVWARELAHPVRRSLQLHKARRSLEVSAKEGKESEAAIDSQTRHANMDGIPQTSGEAASAVEMMEAAFNEEEKALFASWLAGVKALSQMAELQQVLRGSKGGSAQPAWPSASSRHTECLKTSFCSLSSNRLLTGLYSHQLAALDAFKCIFALPKTPHEDANACTASEIGMVSTKLCEALDACREFTMCCCTSVLDTVGELKGLGRPPLAENSGGIRFSIFDALFGLSQASTVSLLLLLAVCQQLRVGFQQDIPYRNANMSN
ncbi:hypothetical protein Emag_004424 [Eimeria magna]